MATETKPPAQVVELDPQDPLPESNWFWRRIFFIGFIVIMSAIKAYETYEDRQDWFTSFLILVGVVTYGIAPSAEQAYKMFQLTTLFKDGISFKRSQHVVATPDKTTASASTEVIRDDRQTTGAESLAGANGVGRVPTPVNDPDPNSNDPETDAAEAAYGNGASSPR
jgi:hypothetical protein